MTHAENARDLERENAELRRQLDEALAREQAAEEILQVINSSPGNLAPVFKAILEKAHRLCGADKGALALYDGEHFRAVATRGLSDAFDELIRQRQGTSPDGPNGRLLRGESLLHIPDIRRVPGRIPQAAAELEGVRTILFVPLRRDGALLGYVTAYRQEVRPFSEKQIALLRNFAAQAVIAMENARLMTETRGALDQQTATAEVLGVINSSPGDLTPVFDAILEKAHALCGAEHGSLMTYDGEFFRAAALHNMAEPLASWLREPFRPAPGDIRERLLRGERLIHVPDLLYGRDDANPENQAALDAGVRTLLIVPLRKDDTLLGYMTANRREVRPFTDKQIALLQNFAAQAVIAMENARLITETREALEQQTATAEVLGVINSSAGDLAPVFEALVDKALALCGANYGFIRTYDGNSFHLGAMRGVPAEHAELLTRPRQPPFTGTALERLVAGESVVEVADVAEQPGYRNTPTARALVDAGVVRTMLWVALRKEGALLGFISVFRSEKRPFTKEQISLLQNFAAQAVIAMENARLITETREALEQQTATAEVLQVINSSPGNVAPVFDAIVQKAMHLCDAAFGYMVASDGDAFRTVAALRVPPEYAEFRRRNPVQPGQPGIAARIRAGEPFVHILDLKDDELYRNGDPQRRAMVDIGGARSGLTVALKKGAEAVGTIDVYRQEVRPFTDKQIALLQNFAAQAVIAMENARLITETRAALEQQTATAEVLQVINSSPGDLAPVFDAMLEKATRLCEAAFGNLTRVDGDQFYGVAFHNAPPGLAEAFRQARPMIPGQGHYRLCQGEEVVQDEDITAGELYRSGIDPSRRALGDLAGARTVLWAALRKGSTLLGAFVIYRREVRPFTDKQIELIRTFADQAVIAIENARLLGELRQRTDEVAELNRGLETRVAEQVEELGRVGRLKRFLAPQLAELIVSQGDEKILESHRREIVVVFCDLRGYTAFTETAEPEEVLDFLREYHGALGPLVSQFEGTLDQFSGDGIMVFFNDPVPVPDPAERAVEMAIIMRETADRLIATWRRRDRDLGFGVGIAQGYATLGQIGFADRSGYTAIGTVCNLAARLCAEAKDGQILVSGRVASAVEETTALEDIGPLVLKGLTQPVSVFNVKGLTAG